MDRIKLLEENLREAACNGDFDIVLEILSTGINIDAKHVINGWTALHWAAKRGHRDIVRILLEQGADPAVTTEKGETPLSLATNPEVRLLLGGEMNGSANEVSLPITPSYMKNPPLNQKSSQLEYQNGVIHRRQPEPVDYIPHSPDELVLKVRVANGGDPDFIEIELGRSELTYYSLLRVCCEELGLNASQVTRLRKLPNTMIRKDKDVQRLSQMQEIEVVISPSSNHPPNHYKSIHLYKNQTILY